MSAHKHAQTHYPVVDVIKHRWSPRAFTPQPLSDDDLRTLFEAAAWAPSAMNEQPWRFIYAHREQTEAFQRIWNCLLPGNQPWAKHAAVLVVVLARKTMGANDAPNRHYLHDTGMATANLLLQAASMGIHGHVMGGFDMAKTQEALHLPADLEPATFLALGYVGEAEQLEEPFRSRELAPRSRKPLSEFVFENELPA
ncbi:nitroreductase family protein [Hymenobacter sp. 15J16-1T3B]|uniref:nitroreductase family protein n=1 Tax=Hymenobacter sp. 15J16-1T3B TaxID=2886941 RepID=UPI001D10C868|nr:nitroreductase family protein [Hymenobacter sp. 15J16-1T3B]MCC3156060.1 nitroreductase family protein [Hymenobacter sp. 15J16-1T3B]